MMVLVVTNPPANAGYTVSIPGSGRSPGEGNDNLLQYSCLENSVDKGASRWGCQELDTPEHACTVKGGQKFKLRSLCFQNAGFFNARYAPTPRKWVTFLSSKQATSPSENSLACHFTEEKQGYQTHSDL